MEDLPSVKRDLRKIRKILQYEAEQKRLGDTIAHSLNCGCAIASFCNHWYLTNTQWRHKFSVCANDHHCFNRWDDTGHIIDTTATQFASKYPQVMIRQFKSTPEHWTVEEEVTDFDEMRGMMSSWTYAQDPFCQLRHISLDSIVKLSDIIQIGTTDFIESIYYES